MSLGYNFVLARTKEWYVYMCKVMDLRCQKLAKSGNFISQMLIMLFLAFCKQLVKINTTLNEWIVSKGYF